MTDTRIAIDLNIRVRGDQTYAGFEDVTGDVPQQGEYVVVYERESGVHGKAEVTEVDTARQLIYLSLNWENLAEDRTVPGGGLLLIGSPPLIGSPLANAATSGTIDNGLSGLMRINSPVTV